MTIATGTPVWADLQSTDRDKARAFYADLFGWEWTVTGEAFNHYANASLGDRLIAGEMGAAAGAPEMAMWSLYLKTEDIDVATAHVEAAGGQVLMKPMTVGNLGAMGFYVDPTGAAFGLWQPASHGGFEISSAHGRPCWFEVYSRDAKTTREFYSALGGGLEISKLDTMDYWMCHADGRPRFGIMPMNEEWEGQSPHWMVYFSVDDTDAAVETIKALGGSVHHGPFDTPPGRMAVAADPQGAVFTVIKPTDG